MVRKKNVERCFRRQARNAEILNEQLHPLHHETLFEGRLSFCLLEGIAHITLGVSTS